MSLAHRRAAALAMIAALFALSGCGGTVLDQQKTEDATQKSLEDSLHEKIRSVDCPSDLSVDPGTTFNCDVTFSDGQQAKATLKIRNQDADASIVGLEPTN